MTYNKALKELLKQAEGTAPGAALYIISGPKGSMRGCSIRDRGLGLGDNRVLMFVWENRGEESLTWLREYVAARQ